MIERIEGADHHLNIKDLSGERDERGSFENRELVLVRPKIRDVDPLSVMLVKQAPQANGRING
jgi:hypothetical protein